VSAAFYYWWFNQRIIAGLYFADLAIGSVVIKVVFPG
jgi:hypothetical protein